MRLTLILSFILCEFFVTVTSTTTPTRTKRWNDGFITVDGNNLKLNGKDFAFLGTNPYWLSTLVTDDDIKKTLTDLKAKSFKVIRTWAFNDVTEIPSDGSVWFQLIKDGRLTLNEGPNGLQKLDKVVYFAEKIGLHLQLVLTNNWNPVEGEVPGKGKDGLRKRHNDKRPRNYLSNDYGGMDAYVREFGCSGEHSEFYTNRTIIEHFKTYIRSIVSRYKDSKALFAWEIANDPRCASSLPSSGECNTLTVTDWVDEIAKEVKCVDENHIVSSGAHGFLCPDCPKRFPPPPPVPSPAPGPHSQKRAVSAKPLTKGVIMRGFREAKEAWRAASGEKKSEKGMAIRGGWVTDVEAREFDPSPSSAFDGSFGVDSQDILGSPYIDIGSYQFFPDQNSYGPVPPCDDDAKQTMEIGRMWINLQSQVSALYNKPTVLNAFGIVTQENLPFFVPFNQTRPAIHTSLRKRQFGNPSDPNITAAGYPLAAAAAKAKGIIHFQPGVCGLTPGNTITEGECVSRRNGVHVTGVSPNDGYRSQPPPLEAGSPYA